MHLLCPHCHGPIELVKLTSGEEISCPSCGSSFHLETGPSVSWTSDSGLKLGRFEILANVGQGAFGTVYKARDPELNRIVALKVPRTGNLAGPHERDRFLREARSVAQLRHPAIVAVHEVGQTDNVPFLVSDFVEGVTLADMLSGRRLAPRDAAELMAAVADALHYAHKQGVVHRDVKPSNIMIGPDGKPVVMDFGLAKREAGEITMTIDGQVLGTPAYMPPEQAGGESHKVDGRSDVYSLGVILYELLTGELPFRGNKRMLLHQVLHDEPRPPRRLNDTIARDLETICLKAMAKEPARRYSSAGDLAEDLRLWLRNEPIRARPVGRAERAWRWCRRNPLVASLLSAVALSLLGGAAVSTVFALEMRRERDTAEEASRQEAKQREIADEQRAAADFARAGEAQERERARQRAAVYALETGRMLCEQGDVDRGLHWFARALRDITPADRGLDFEARINLALWRTRTPALRACAAHTGELRTLVFSRDGKALLSASLDRTARLWNGDTGEPLGEPLKHSHQVEAAALGADGKTVLTGCFDGTLRLWDGAAGKLLAGPLDLKSLVREVVLLPDGKTAHARTNSGDVFLVTGLDEKAPVVRPLLEKGRFTCIALSPDGSTLATGSSDKTLRMWRAADGTPLGEPLPHAERIEFLAFSGSGGLLATASDMVRLGDVKTGAARGLIPHSSIRDIAFAPDGKVLATASNDTTVRVWDIATQRLRMPALVHRTQVAHAGFTPDGKVLLTASGGSVRLLDAATGAVLASPRRDAGMFAVRPDGRMLAAGSLEGPVRLWEIDAGLPPPVSVPHDSLVRAAAFSPDGKLVLSADQKGTALLWDAISGERRGEPLQHTGTIESVAFSQDGKLAATGSWDKTAKLWTVADGKPLGLPLSHPDAVHRVAFTPDGKALVTGCNDGGVRVWDTATGKEIGEPLMHGGSVRRMALSPDGKTVVAGGFGPAASVWDLPGRKRLAGLQHQRGGVGAIAFSPDGAVCVTAEGGRPYLWNTATWSLLVSRIEAHERGIEAVAFSPDGKTLLTGSWDGTARLWQVPSGKVIASLSHEGAVLCVAFSPDGQLVLTGSADNTARIWSAATHRPLGPPLRHRGELSVAAIAPDSRAILTASGAARLMRLSALSTPAKLVSAEIEVWTGAALGSDGVMRMSAPEKWREGMRTIRELPPRQVWPLSSLRGPHHDDPGPFGRSHLSGR